MDISTIVLLFFIYSFMGWISEVVYCSVIERRFVNRGFLFGPLCPVYGFGGLLIVFLLQPFSGTLVSLFVMAVIVTSVLEYGTGWALEKIFSTKWWDYSQYRFNIHGRVCLLNSILFGVMGVLAVRYVHPAIMNCIGLLSIESRPLLASALSSVLLVDFAFTLRSLVDFREKLVGLAEFMDSIRDSIDLGEWFNEKDLKGSLERLRARARIDANEVNMRITVKLEQVIERAKGMRRLISAFPGMTSLRHNDQIDIFKRLLVIGKSVKSDLSELSDTVTATISSGVRGVPGEANRSGKRALAQPSGLIEYMFAFITTSAFGTVLETVWAFMAGGSFDPRTALVFGYVNPLYGFAGLFLLFAYSRISAWRDLSVILVSFVAISVFVYSVSILQEALLFSVSWNFEGLQPSFQGRIHLLYALALSVASLFWMRDAFPVLLRWFRLFNRRLAATVVLALMLVMSIDSVVSAAAVKRWADRKKGSEAVSPVSRYLDANFPDAVMEKRYSSLQFIDPED